MVILAVVFLGAMIFGLGAAIFTPGIPGYVKVLIVIAIAGGAALIFATLRQRYMDSKTDKYKDVEV